LLWLLGTVPGFATGNIVKSDLKGTWRISLRGQTADCGFASMLATITFDTSGAGTGPLQIHGDCGDSTLAGQTFTVDTLSKTGTGTASMTCGAACEWNFDIQVAPDRTKFNLVDVTPGNDYVEGLAILSSPADHIAVADMKGTWQVALMGHRLVDCGAGLQVVKVSSVGTLTLDVAGTGTLDTTAHTSCGDADAVGTVTVTGLNADGGGTVHVDCDGGCFDLSIQVSPDRSVFSFVTVSPADAGDVLAGVGIRRSTAGHISKPNLAAPWQGTLQGQDTHDDVGAALMTFKLNAKALSKKVTITIHDTEGDGTVTDLTFTVLTLDPDGSGTARFGIAPDTIDFRIQVSPDRSMMSVVVVDPASEDFLEGVFIAQ
jgi:hypothetical protein